MTHSGSEMLAQALKGLLAAQGAGSGITRHVVGIQVGPIEVREHMFPESLLAAVEHAGTGAVVTVASKVVSIVQNRQVIDGAITAAVRRRCDLQEVVELLRKHDRSSGDREALVLDQGPDPDSWVLAPTDPNGFCADFSATLEELTGTRVDVVIADSGSGHQKGVAAIGCETFMSTPLAATRGLSLVHAQRCAVISEFVGNASTSTPLAVIEPESWRSRDRPHIGAPRYRGYLDTGREHQRLPFLRSG